MAKNPMSSDFQSVLNEQREISDTEIGAAYRLLADEHVALRAGASPQAKSALADAIWKKIEHREQFDAVDAVNTSRGSGGSRPRFRAAQTRVWGVALACAAMVAGGLYFSDLSLSGPGFQEGRVSFEVDGAVAGADQGGQGRLIASESDPVGIRLSDRSQLNLQPHTTLRLAALSDGVVIARLAQGSLDAEVVHQKHTNYQFFAGPYLVKVIGTAFRLSYEPEGESLELKMRSGVVEVVGAEGESRIVRGGESLHWKSGGKGDGEPESDVLRDESSQRRRSGSSAQNEEGTEGTPEAILGDQSGTSDLSPPKTPSSGVAPSEGRASVLGPSDFHQLATRGRFSEIVSIADKYGIDKLLAQGSVSQLQELAQAARYSGRLTLAEQVWSRMASRFSSTLSGKNALFFIGRLDEQRGRSSSALAHYESYLRKSPGGVYAQEAWGRKLQLSQQSGDTQATRRIAQQYLQRFPQGPFAATARQLSSKVSGR